MRKTLLIKKQGRSTGEVMDAKGKPRRFTKKGAFSFLRTHGDRTQIKITDGGDSWIGLLEGGTG